MTIDKRKKYILMMDTETCNSGEEVDAKNSLVYDVGMTITDKKGNIYDSQSWVVGEIFYGDKTILNSAYYAKKLPQYHQDIRDKKRYAGSIWDVRKSMINLLDKYNTRTICAHNAYFDLNALNATMRYITKSKYRYFFPYDIEIWDTLKMSRAVICKMPSYKAFCKRNGYMTGRNQPRATAEILYKFISSNNEFEEAHTGQEDTFIEAKILAYCFKQKKKMPKQLFNS